jgi:hypothetical protein
LAGDVTTFGDDGAPAYGAIVERDLSDLSSHIRERVEVVLGSHGDANIVDLHGNFRKGHRSWCARAERTPYGICAVIY